MPPTPAPADVDLDAADFDGDQPPTKKTRVDNSRATHDPHETFQDMTWLEYASFNGIDLNSAVTHMLEAEFRAAAKKEREQAG